MAEIRLTGRDIDLAFAFARTEPGTYRDATGAVRTAPPGAPRLDHDAAGAPLGLLVAPGEDFGGGDRLTIDPLMLPARFFDFATPQASDATVFHHFNDGTGPVRRAWYSRNARATIDALLRLAGHHLEIGAVAGHRPPEAGLVRYRGQGWLPPGIVLSGARGVEGAPPLPLIAAGAEKPAGG